MMDYRRLRMVRLRHDAPGDVAHTFNELMRRGVAYGHMGATAEIGALAEVLDVKLTAAGDVLILYQPPAGELQP
jgi:hypothetical protein